MHVEKFIESSQPFMNFMRACGKATAALPFLILSHFFFSSFLWLPSLGVYLQFSLVSSFSRISKWDWQNISLQPLGLCTHVSERSVTGLKGPGTVGKRAPQKKPPTTLDSFSLLKGFPPTRIYCGGHAWLWSRKEKERKRTHPRLDVCWWIARRPSLLGSPPWDYKAPLG